MSVTRQAQLEALVTVRRNVLLAYGGMLEGKTPEGFAIGKVLTYIDEQIEGDVPFDAETLSKRLLAVKKLLIKYQDRNE